MIWFLSQCGKKAILRLDSLSMIDKVIKTLGLDSDIESIEREMIVNCKPGRVIIPGNWACEHGVFYCAARKTLEGEEIWNKYWARPILDVPSFNNLK
jgi:hypothetical protein